MKVISQRTFPKEKSDEEIRRQVESIGEFNNTAIMLKKALKLILSSGFRICEVLNSYIYKEGNVYIIRGLNEKKTPLTKFRMFKRGFLGEAFLMRNLTQKHLWKSVPLLNLFNLDMSWVEQDCSESFTNPHWIFRDFSYHRLYYALKKSQKIEMEVYYVPSKYDVPVSTQYIPSFHFYRKAFAVKLKEVMPDPVDRVNYMRWEKLDQILQYDKLAKGSILLVGSGEGKPIS